MPRHNHTKHPNRPKLEDRFDTDACSLPQYPHIDRIIVVPLKTICRNMDACPWAEEVVTATNMDHPLLRQIINQI